MKIKEIQKFIKEKYPRKLYLHTMRVYKNALMLLEKEGGDPQIVKPATLLHDVGKLVSVVTHPQAGAKYIRENLSEWFDEGQMEKIIECIKSSHPYPPFNTKAPQTLEAKIVVDADHLDLIRFAFIKLAIYLHNVGKVDYSEALKEIEKTIQKWYKTLSTKTAKNLAKPLVATQNKLITQIEEQLNEET